jgi:hypothetical protein
MNRPKRFGSSIVALTFYGLMGAALADDPPDACASAQVALQAKMKGIQDEYRAKMDSEKVKFAQQAQKIQSDSDASKPSAVGAVLKFDIKVDWKDQTLIFDTPTVTLNQTHMIIGLPQVTLNQQKWIYDLPATRMGRQKIGQHPEFTCNHAFIPACNIEWKDNYADIPEFYMERHQTILGVPEFAVRNTDIIMGIPAIAMQRQRFVIGLPQITVHNVTAELNSVQQEASDFQEQAEHESAAITNGMKSEIQRSASGDLHNIFICERTRLETNRAQSLASMDQQVATAKSAADNARANHDDAAAKTGDAVVAQIVVTRAAVNAQFDDAARKLEVSEKAALASLVENNPASARL